MNRNEAIKRCCDTRSGNGVNAWHCYDDMCPHCSQPRTNWLKQDVKEWVDGSPGYTFITIVLGPCRSYQQGVTLYRDALDKLRRLGVEGIGVFEIADRHNSKPHNLVALNAVMPYMELLHVGIAHLHFISRQPYKDVMECCFPLKKQVRQDKMGVGGFSKLTHDENVERTVEYMRKRKGVTVHDLVNGMNEYQEVFKLDGGVLYDIKQSDRYVDAEYWWSVDEGCGSVVANGVSNIKQSLEDIVTAGSKIEVSLRDSGSVSDVTVEESLDNSVADNGVNIKQLLDVPVTVGSRIRPESFEDLIESSLREYAKIHQRSDELGMSLLSKAARRIEKAIHKPERMILTGNGNIRTILHKPKISEEKKSIKQQAREALDRINKKEYEDSKTASTLDSNLFKVREEEKRS